MLDEIKLAFRENKWAIILSIAILLISIVLGYILEPHLYSYLNPVVEDLTQKVQTGVITLTFSDIFLNNLKIILQMFVFGIAFCFSVLILGFNGFFVGYYVATSSDRVRVLLLIIPHGIFEFSSCILACASGLILFNFIMKFIQALWHDECTSVKVSLKNSFSASSKKLRHAIIIFCISVILMAIAGFIEVYLTLPIAEYIIKFL